MCVSPLRRVNSGSIIWVPCGRCYQCVRKKKLDWEVRLFATSLWADCSFFKLLTYDEEHYPNDDHNVEALKKQLQLFLARIRVHLARRFSKDLKLKYFIVSEYGEKKDRLHYHCLFFIKGAKFTWLEFNEILKSDWPFGVIGNCYNLSPKEISYCCKYIQKQYNFKLYSQFEVKEIAPGLFDYLRSIGCCSEDPERLPFYPYKGKKVPLPSYWLRTYMGKLPTYVIEDLKEKRSSQDEMIYKSMLFWNKDGQDMRPLSDPRIDNSDIPVNNDF